MTWSARNASLQFAWCVGSAVRARWSYRSDQWVVAYLSRLLSLQTGLVWFLDHCVGQLAVLAALCYTTRGNKFVMPSRLRTTRAVVSAAGTSSCSSL
jgi:hypothetical protein